MESQLIPIHRYRPPALCDSRTDRPEIFCWDWDDWVIWYKRLEARTFQFPFADTGQKRDRGLRVRRATGKRLLGKGPAQETLRAAAGPDQR